MRTFQMKGFLQSEPFKAKVLILAKAGGLYNVIAYTSASIDEETKSGLAHGWYDFVVLATSASTCWVRREQTDRALKYPSWSEKADMTPRSQPGSTRGHSSIAQGKDVYWAGKLLFTGGASASYSSGKGTLREWNNSSGHYMKGQVTTNAPEVAKLAKEQTCELKAADGSPLLPMEVFRPWDGGM